MSSFLYPNKGEKREYHLMKLRVSLLIIPSYAFRQCKLRAACKKRDKTDLSTDEAGDTNGNSDEKTNSSLFYHPRKV
jgi:hypothetical protein